MYIFQGNLATWFSSNIKQMACWANETAWLSLLVTHQQGTHKLKAANGKVSPKYFYLKTTII